MSEPMGTGLAAIAWLVAVALASAVGAIAFAASAHRRACAAEENARALQGAVDELSDAIRARLRQERERLGAAGYQPEGAEEAGEPAPFTLSP